ncbi:hypothetical protein EC957_011211 [Mortierella hygrophila]|uniref:Uncharacterized protein n=1 Tax=Mortierella hygrophila TaxID=979708 RepID=A0A9P6F8U4_9FUNG|nr:hypothetical protein EC957_011211 [Mortierella hygrophila]
MEGVHSRHGEHGYVANSLDGSLTSTTPSAEGGPSRKTTATAPASTVGKTWQFALLPAPPLETSPALIRKFLSTEALTGSSSHSSSSPSVPSHLPPASRSSSSSSYAGLFVTAPAVAAVNPVQFLATSRVVVAEAASFIGQHPISSSASALSNSTTTLSTEDNKESTPSILAASLLSYETTTTLLEQEGDDNSHASSLLARWQQRSPSPLGQYSIAAGPFTDTDDHDDRSVTSTPSGRANSLRTKPSFDSLSVVDRPGTPSSCSSPAQELFSRIMDQNNDHINNNSRRHSMGSLVDIMASKARIRRNSLMDLLIPFTSSKPTPPSTPLEDDHRSTTATSSSSSSTITRRRSETNGSATSASTTSSSPCPSPILRKLGSRSSLSLVAPPLVVPQIKQSPKLSHATLLSLTPAPADTNDSSSSDPSSSQPNNTNNNGTLRRPKYQVLTAPGSTTVGGPSNKPSPLPSFTVVNEIWMDPTTNTLHQLPGVLLTPSLPFPLTLPILPPSSSDNSIATASTITQLPSTTAAANGPVGTPESVEWPWTNMNPADRDKWPAAFHISAQHGGILALPPTYSPGSELDEATAISFSRTHSYGLPLDYGSSVMEARRYFGTGGMESVQSSLAESRVSGSGSLYFDETLGQTPYGNGYYYGQQHAQPGPLGPPAATGY